MTTDSSTKVIEIDLETPSPTSSVTQDHDQDYQEFCHVCHTNLAIYGPINCLHVTLCKKCAMKQATGGRCKVCKILFSELKKVLQDT